MPPIHLLRGLLVLQVQLGLLLVGHVVQLDTPVEAAGRRRSELSGGGAARLFVGLPLGPGGAASGISIYFLHLTLIIVLLLKGYWHPPL